MIKKNQRYFAFLFGIIFIVAMLILAIVFPEPTSFQYTVFRIVLSIATAGAAAMIPGFVELNIPGWIRASGALAVFVLVYFYNPGSLVTPSIEQSKQDSENLSMLEGKVLDENGNVLSGVSIQIEGTTLGAMTDVDGYFKIELPAGTYTIQLNYTGYSTKIVGPITIESNKPLNLGNITL